jgi:phosphoribosylformylglycinamidine synthase
MIVFVGGFSNSDVLGSAKGWAGAFMFNEKAKTALMNFYKRPDTLSLGVCNGCQLMMELGLITPRDNLKPKMLHNDTGKFESGFVSVEVKESGSVMLNPLVGSRLGVWIAHGEGKFRFPHLEEHYNICMKYTYDELPGNPNGSEYSAAGICSDDGRHLAIMPHIERSVFPWQWAYYPEQRTGDMISPWLLSFVAARQWVENHLQVTK